MKGRIVHLKGDGHESVQLLLPWYVTGRLDPAEAAAVEAHLQTCAECQAEVRFEHRLGEAVAGLPTQLELGWAQLQRRVEKEKARRAWLQAARTWLQARGEELAGAWRVQPGWLRAAVLGQTALLIAAAVLLAPGVRTAPYHALGAPPAARTGDLVVIFKPDIREAELRGLLRAQELRLVDGPTPTGAYLLRAPAGRRADVLTKLRGRPEIQLAEPVDPASAP